MAPQIFMTSAPNVGSRLLVRALLCAAHPMRSHRVSLLVTLAVLLFTVGRARAEGSVPPPVEVPQQLSLDRALELLKTRSLDLLISEAAVENAEGDVKVSGAVPNLSLQVGYGKLIGYNADVVCQTAMTTGCSTDTYMAGLSDQAAIEDSLSGKRDLRLRVSRAALAAAKLSRNDALRTLQFQVKSAYVQVAQAQRAVAFAKEVQATNVTTLELFRVKLRAGTSNEGEVARIETQKLEADQAVDSAVQSLEQARFALAFLLGARGPVPEYSVDATILDFTVPSTLATADADRLLRAAFEHRPDLKAQGFQATSAEAAISLAKRQVFPDIAIGAQYAQTGTGNAAVSPPSILFTLSAPIPIFYQQQGEIRKAEANYETQSLTHAKLTAQVVSDVATALSAFRASRALVERMEKALRPSAELAYSKTRVQYDKNSATLMDLLDAQRTFIATNVEYLQDLANYWTAVYQLEQAVGMELRQ
jgi:cobalt-zinc-cadmium efflux system outer membrane protein